MPPDGSAVPDASDVSVVVPTRGPSPFLGAALASALRQPETAELIVVHDRAPGAPDLAPDAVPPLADARVRVVVAEGTGPAAARNTGLRAAARPTVAFLDDDDAWLPGHLAAVRAAFAAHRGAGVVATDATTIVDEDGTARLPTGGPAWRGGGPERAASYRELLLANPVLTSAAAVATDRFATPPRFDATLATMEDYDLWLRLRRERGLLLLPAVTALIRRRPRSASRDLRSMAECGIAVLERALAAAPAGDTLSGPERRARLARLRLDLAYACLAEGDGRAARRAALRSCRDRASLRGALYLAASLAPALARRRLAAR